jgi:hypothetical protein
MTQTLHEALQRFEHGHMTRSEAAALMVHLMQTQPDIAQRYTHHINALIDGGFIQQRNGIWYARRMGGRPRKATTTKPRETLTLRIDADMVAALDNHPLRRFMSRNDLIAFLLGGALKL